MPGECQLASTSNFLKRLSRLKGATRRFLPATWNHGRSPTATRQQPSPAHPGRHTRAPRGPVPGAAASDRSSQSASRRGRAEATPSPPAAPRPRRRLGPRPHPYGPGSHVEDAAPPLQLPLPPPLQGGGFLQVSLQPQPDHGAEGATGRHGSAARRGADSPQQHTGRRGNGGPAPSPLPPSAPAPAPPRVAGPRGCEREAGGSGGGGARCCRRLRGGERPGRGLSARCGVFPFPGRQSSRRPSLII